MHLRLTLQPHGVEGGASPQTLREFSAVDQPIRYKSRLRWYILHCSRSSTACFLCGGGCDAAIWPARPRADDTGGVSRTRSLPSHPLVDENASAPMPAPPTSGHCTQQPTMPRAWWKSARVSRQALLAA
eukprot:6283222-Prymnesium_polylepis.1